MPEDRFLKHDDFGDGYSGLVQPKSGTIVGHLECNGGVVIHLTNTGPTKLTFNLIQNNHVEHLIDQFILQPGEFRSLDLLSAIDEKSQTLQVSNTHPQKEGAFVVLVKDGKMRFPGWE
jgi:hypothetical protein